MLSIEKEEQVRKLLAAGVDISDAANRANVARWTVKLIAFACNAVKTLTTDQCDEIRLMLTAGATVSAVEAKMLIPRATVCAIRRYYYLHRRKPGGWRHRKCPTCGSLMLPTGQHKKHRKNNVPNTITGKTSIALYRIAQDLIELDRLRLIPNPLFYNLARQAEKTLEEINVKEANIAG